MTAIDLARIMHEEFERDAWGDIDPYLFEGLANSLEDPSLLDPDETDQTTEIEGLAEVLERVVARIKIAAE
jgi:hypothetical protein